MRELHVHVPGASPVSASLHGQGGGTLLALAHGAGGTRSTPQLLRLAESLASGGRRVLLFNFPYSEAGRRAPDRPAALEATVRAVARHVREQLAPARLVLGGRSMGGRMASQCVAAGLACDALLLLAYPLHPPGQPGQLRDAHLPRIGTPMLFVQGTRDAFARSDLLEATLARLQTRARLCSIADGDHSFAVPARSGRKPAEVEAGIAGSIEEWLSALGL
jgi:hypothetical protein